MTDPEGPSAAFEVRFTAAARRSLNAIPPRVLSAVVEFTFGDLAREHAASASRYETTWPACSVPVAGPTVCSIESTTQLASSSSSEWTTALTFTGPNRC